MCFNSKKKGKKEKNSGESLAFCFDCPMEQFVNTDLCVTKNTHAYTEALYVDQLLSGDGHKLPAAKGKKKRRFLILFGGTCDVVD